MLITSKGKELRKTVCGNTKLGQEKELSSHAWTSFAGCANKEDAWSKQRQQKDILYICGGCQGVHTTFIFTYIY